MSILSNEGAVLENLEVQCPNCGPVTIFISELDDFMSFNLELDICQIILACPKCKAVFIWD